MNEFTIDGLTGPDLGVVLLRHTARPALPPTVDRTLVIPGRHGALDFGADMGPRPFSLELAFIEKDRTALEQRIGALSRLLTDRFGRPRTVPLTLPGRADQTFYVRYMGQLVPDRIYGTGVLTLPMVAFEPFAFGPEQITETMLTTSPVGITLTSAGQVHTDAQITLTNLGGSTITSFTITHEYEIGE